MSRAHELAHERRRHQRQLERQKLAARKRILGGGYPPGWNHPKAVVLEDWHDEGGVLCRMIGNKDDGT
jgi:hypothetical protein